MEKSLSFINRLFNLKKGDFARGLPLFAYYFLIISSYGMGRTARDSLFLDQFKAVQLPYADIAVAALVGFIVALYIRLGRRINLRNLQFSTLVLFAFSYFAFWFALHTYRWIWLSPMLYVWVGIFGVIAVTQVWTIANFVWTTREAKRLFGMLGSGGIAGGIAGGFITKWAAPRFGTESILILIGVFVALAAALVIVIWRQRPEGEDVEQSGPRNLIESFRMVRQSPHLQAIAALICVSSIVTTGAGWQLKAIAKETFVHKDMLTAFLGGFQAYAGIASLAAQLFITSKLLRRFGIGVALLVLPLSMTAGSVAVAASGMLWAATLLKGSDQVFRYSVDTSALQLLYLPIPVNIKLQVKSFIDTVIWRFGDGLAGLTLLVFATNLHFTPRQISYVNIVVLGAWIAAAFVARRQYVSTLKENIQHVRIQPEQVTVPVLDPMTEIVFSQKLNSTDVNEVMYALDLFRVAEHVKPPAAVRALLQHPSPHVRKKVVAILSEAGDVTTKSHIAALLTDNSLEVRTEALLYLSRHDEMDPLNYVQRLGDFADFSIRSATISFLMRPGDAQNLVAARVMLDGMIADLGDSEVCEDAARALLLLGDAAVPALRDSLADRQIPLEIRRQIPGVLHRIGTLDAAAALADNLVQADTELRFRVISALNKLHEFHGGLPVDRQVIETAMVAEMMGHYRSYQILGASNGSFDDRLKESMKDEIERIFRLMKLLFPSLDLQNAYIGIQSKDPVTHANALEFLDNTLSPHLRSRLVPLIDSDVPIQERVKLADRFLGFTAT